MNTKQGVATTGPARWARLAALGLLMAALGPILMLLAGLVWGLDIGEDLPFFLIPAVVGMIGAFQVLRFNALWAKVAGIVVAILTAGPVFWTVFRLFAPNSFFDFVPGLLVMPGAIIAIVGCVAGIVAHRRGKADASPADGERKTIRTVLAVVGVLAVASAIFTFVGKESVGEGEADTSIALTDFEFDKESYTFDGGTKILVRNDDPFIHSFTIDGLDIDEMLSPGSEVLVEIPDEPGDYVLYCMPHTNDPENPTEDDMKSDLTVQ